jgi:autotransporter-associated beta strand protein
MNFSTSGTTTLLGGNSTTPANNDLFIGTFTVNAGSGAVTIGDTAVSPTARVNLKAGSISFTNNSSSLLALANGLNSFGSGSTTTFTFTGNGNIRAGGVIGNGTGSNVVALTKTGNGTLTLAGVNTYSAATTISGGQITVASTGVINNANATTGTGTISGAATLRVDGGTAKFNASSSGNTGLQVGTTTAGNVVVTNNGTLTVSTGRMILGGTGAGTGTSTFTQDSGTTTVASNLYTANFNATDINISGGSFTVSGSSIISQRANTNFNISGTASVNFGATVTLGGQTGSYTPIFNLNGGTLSVVNIADSANGTSAVNFNGGTLQARADNADFLRADAVTISNSGGTIDTQAFNVNIGQNLLRLSGATTDSLTKIGTGRLTLTGTNTYGGGSSVSAGVLQFGNTAALPSSGAYAATGNGTLAVNAGGGGEFSNATSGTGSIGGFFSGASFASGTAFGIDTTNAGGSLSYAGNLNGSGIGITKLGTGTLTLSGNNGYTGPTTINAGTLQAGSATAFAGGGALVMANAAATFDLNGNNISFTNLTAGSASNTITTTAAGSGTDTLTLSALSAASGALFADNGTRKLALNFTSGSGSIPATTNISNTYSGGLILNTGMRINPLSVANTTGGPGAITSGPFGRGSITLNGTTSGNGSQIYFNGANLTLVNDVIVNSNTGNGSRSGSFRISGAGAVVSGNITANDLSAVFGADVAGSLTLTGKLSGANGFTFNQSSGTNAWIATLNNASANNDYVGATTIGSAQTTLRLGAANQIPNGASTGNVALTLGTLDLNGYSETINGLTGAGILDNVTATGGASNTLTIGDNNATGNNFTGTIRNTAGSLSVVKIGSGSQSLQTGTNTFSGGLTIRNGSIIALNSTVLGGAGGNSGAITLGDTSGTNPASLLIGSNNTTLLNAITLATNATVGNLTLGISTGVVSSAFSGGVTGSNNLVLANGGSGTLTFQTNAINNVGTVTNSGGGGGSASIAIGFGSNVTDIIQDSATSTLSIASGVASTNTGSTYIKAGTLRLNGAGGSTSITPLNGTIYVGDTVGSNNATLEFANTNVLTNPIVVQSNGNASTKALSVYSNGTPVYSGGLTLNDNLDITASSTTGMTIQTGDVTINDNSTLSFKPSGTNAATFTISSKITGAGGKVDFGGTTSASPTFVLTGTNDYTGTTTISKGTLRIGNTTATGSLSPSSAITNNAAISFLRTNAVVQGTDFANNITGTGSVAVAAGGTYTFTANAFQGGMTLSGANTTQLNINHADALGTGTFAISGGDNARIDNTSGSLVTLNNNAQTWSNNFTFIGTNDLDMGTGAVSMGGSRTLTINAGNLTVGGAISGSGFGIIKAGSGTLLLTNNNNFTGNVTVNAGLLSISNSNALGSGAKTFAMQGTNRRLELTNSITLGSNVSLNLQTNTNSGVISSSGTNEIQGAISLTGGGTSIGSDGTSTLTLSGNITANGGTGFNLYGTSGNDNTVAGVIADGTSTTTLTKDQAGTWVLSNANTYRGNTRVTGGTLKLTNNLAIQNSAFDTSGAGTLDVTSINTPTFGGLTSAGDLVLPSNVTSLTLNPGSGTQTYTGNLSGGTAMQLVKSGAGTQILGGTNSYTGLTTVNSGELRIASANALNGTSGISVAASGAGLSLNGGISVGSGKTVTINGTGIGSFNSFGALTNNGGDNTWEGNVTIGSAATRIGSLSGNLTVSGVIDSGAAVTGLTVRLTNSTTNLTLTNANTYLGDTLLITAGGALILDGGDDRLPVATNLILGASTVSGILDLNGRNQEVAGISVNSGTANEIRSATGATLTVNSASAASTFGSGGSITGGISLVKEGGNSLTLAGTNTYTGATTINEGTLALGATGSIDNTSGVALGGGTFDVSAKSGGYTVNNLTGTGSVVGGLTVSTTLAIGNSPGQVSFDGNLTLGKDSLGGDTILSFNYDLIGGDIGASAADLGIVSGDLTLASAVFLDLFQLGSYTLGDTFTLFAYEGSLTGTFDGLAEGATFTDAGGDWKINYAATAPGQNYAVTGQNYVNITAIPEPNVAALLGALGTLILLRRRRA